MGRSLGDPVSPGLEASCSPPGRDWIRAAPPQAGLERIEASFAGRAFAPHRHDSYALGLTTQGVQSFGYRGSAHRSLPGEALVLHPDELHDGYAGADEGFGYRILYLDPALVRRALGSAAGPLPFVRQGVTRDRRLVPALAALLVDLGRRLEPLERDSLLAALVEALQALAGAPPPRAGPLDRPALLRARALLDAASAPVASRLLERETGLDRFALARQFRRCWGTSPHRYVLLRRLERAKAAIAAGEGLAAAAAATGFADQSHLTRQFKAAYGLTPGRWRRLAAAA